MNMMRTLFVVSLVVISVGCGLGSPIVESRCDSQFEYYVTRQGDAPRETLRLHLKLGSLVSPNGCTNSLGRRSNTVVIETSAKSLDEIRKIIESEVLRYKQARTSELPKLPANQK